MKTERVFFPEAESVYHEDYQCEYYRGVIIDGEDNIVERCSDMHPTYERAKQDALEKMASGPLYRKQASPELKEKLQEFKRLKEERERKHTICIYSPGEWNEWQYIYDRGIYRFRYINQSRAASITLTRKSESLLGLAVANKLDREGQEAKAFYMSRVKSIYDIEHLPGHKDIWKITRVHQILQKSNGDVEVGISYLKYGNLRKDYGKVERKKKLLIKRRWGCFDELMERFADGNEGMQ